MFSKRFNLFTGHFGSGKTEVSVNYAKKLKEKGYKTAIVDMDVVNPYFRTADVKNELKNAGVRVVVPSLANTNVDVPNLPSEINSLFENEEVRSIFDIGGDDMGAKVIGRYRHNIAADNYNMFLVVNTLRPFTNTEEKIINMIREIESSCRLKITGFINNTNLLDETNVGMVLKGHELINHVSKTTEIPIKFISGFFNSNEINRIEKKFKGYILNMKKMIRKPWEKD